MCSLKDDEAHRRLSDFYNLNLGKWGDIWWRAGGRC
nr:MAG TPA: hypothetical protein [Caudoviricetes sp.]